MPGALKFLHTMAIFATLMIWWWFSGYTMRFLLDGNFVVFWFFLLGALPLLFAAGYHLTVQHKPARGQMIAALLAAYLLAQVLPTP